MGGDLVILHLVCRKGGKGRLQGVHQLALQPGCDLGCVILGGDVAAHVGVEQQRVADAAGEAAVAPQVHRELVAPLLADHHPEGDGGGGAVQDLAQLLGVDVVHALILAGVAAVSKALGHGQECFRQTVAEVAGKNAWLGRSIEGELARLSAHLHHAALLHDEHALSVCHGDAAAVGDDVVLAVVGAAAGGALLALDHQHILVQRIAVEKFLPLVCKGSAQCAHTCFDKTHSNFLLLFVWCKRQRFVIALRSVSITVQGLDSGSRFSSKWDAYPGQTALLRRGISGCSRWGCRHRSAEWPRTRTACRSDRSM